MDRLCKRCPGENERRVVATCCLCFEPLCSEHARIVIRNGNAMCTTCLPLRNQLGDVVETIPVN